jgi:hypothetical protein
MIKFFYALIVVWFAIFTDGSCVIAQSNQKLEFFESKIRPVLIKHCYECHSRETGKSKGGLFLDSQQGWQTGGDSGPAIVPHKPDDSLIFLAVSHSGKTSEMPPTSRLAAQVVNDFKRWISDGAIDSRIGEPTVVKETTLDIVAGREFWSFRPRRRVFARQSIDRFVSPQAPSAPANQLVRRLFLDLIGLPPTLKERQEFLRLYLELSPSEAITLFSNRLLQRKQFGEKWARHWLDVVRYADSNGGDFNLTFPESWRYRNYVIDAFNHDMPYDQFLREQIAGDLLPFDSLEQRNRQLIATGFLMVAPKMLTERNKAKMHLDIADEQLDTIGRAIMGLTLGCARCHDHKFDPVPTADYYALAGILHSTKTADRVLMDNINVSGWTETKLEVDDLTAATIATHQTKIKRLEEELKSKSTAARKYTSADFIGVVVDDTAAERSGPWRKSTLRPNHVGDFYLATSKGMGPYSIKWKTPLKKSGKYELRVSFGGGSGLAETAEYIVRHAKGESRLVVNQTVRPPINGLWYPLGRFDFGTAAEVVLSDQNAGGFVIADAIQLVHVDQLEIEDESLITVSSDELKTLEQKLAALKKAAPKVPLAMAARDNANERLGDLHIRIRGESNNLGVKVPRGFLEVVSFIGSKKASVSNDESGRLQLAEWVSHPNHPLTARVIANRVWQHLFGMGIVETSDNFGTRGTKPSHPELLDYLAGRLIASQWSIKVLIQEIVDSKTYQQSAQIAAEEDPRNTLFQHQNFRPATAETMRDSMLAIAGELDLKARNSVVEPLGMFAITTTGVRHQSLGETEQLRQRSIYLPIARGAIPPALAIFDFPNPDLVTGKRAVTTVPVQALFMMNSPFVREMANAVGLQFTKSELSLEEIIQELYQRILIRDADANDVSMGYKYVTRLMSSGKSQRESIGLFVQILFSSTEFRFIQ